MQEVYYPRIRAGLLSAAFHDSLSVLYILPATARGAAQDPRVLHALAEWVRLSRELLALYPVDDTALLVWSSVADADRVLAEKLLPLFEERFASRGAHILIDGLGKDLHLRANPSEYNIGDAEGIIAKAARKQQSKIMTWLLKKGGPLLRVFPFVAAFAKAYDLTTCMANERGKAVPDLSIAGLAKCELAQSWGFLFQLISFSMGNEAQAAEHMSEETAERMLDALRRGTLCNPGTVPSEKPWCYPPYAFAELLLSKTEAAGLLVLSP